MKQEPVIFLKPTSSYLENGGTIEIPHPLDSLHHEVELAVVIGQKARDVPESVAMEYIGGINYTNTIFLLLKLCSFISNCTFLDFFLFQK